MEDPDSFVDALQRVWKRTAVQVGEFHTEAGHWPSARAEEFAERRLGGWLRTQRKASRGGRGAAAFTAARRAHLDEKLPGWDDMADLEASWAAAAGELKRFHGRHHRWPSTRGKTALEVRLGRWLSTQRANIRPARRARLDEILPGWDDNGADTRWGTKAQELARFQNTNGRLPTAASADDEERLLGYWLARQRVSARAGKPSFTEDRRQALNQTVPGWDAP